MMVWSTPEDFYQWTQNLLKFQAIFKPLNRNITCQICHEEFQGFYLSGEVENPEPLNAGRDDICLNCRIEKAEVGDHGAPCLDCILSGWNRCLEPLFCEICPKKPLMQWGLCRPHYQERQLAIVKDGFDPANLQKPNPTYCESLKLAFITLET